MGESLTFWYCIESTRWPDVVDILLIVFDALGLLLNTVVSALLFMLRGPCKTSLALLRGLVVSCAMVCLVNLIEDVAPKVQKTHSYHFNRLVCIFWESRFIYWVFWAIASQFLFFFAAYRFVEMTGADEAYKMISEEYQVTAYSSTIVVFSVFITSPQTFAVNLEGDDCNCSHRKINIPLLSIIYAQVYLWFALLIVFDGCVLAYISVCLLRWLRTPCRREDKLELLHFYDTTIHPQLSADTISAATSSRRITGSMCIIPLFVSYLVSLSYDQLYQFASAVNLTTYVIGAPAQKFGELLIVGHCFTVPIIVIIFIRPLRLGLKKCWKRLTDEA